jgi:hypothetical protein
MATSQPIAEASPFGGEQKVYRFDNGYGASVVRHQNSYGGRDGLWEVAVLRFTGSGDKYVLTYDTPITNDVLGWLTDEQVASTLADIEALEAAS